LYSSKRKATRESIVMALLLDCGRSLLRQIV